ncbi:uncharacterized protein LOC115975455 isoform X1 [Quercus lobata]|uniref:uncharacterized protein LOC115975455 isoform X1 n=1 Tax=Quercus lobata TaxID=97700 RepID=UPI00124846D4|nr:uncharacterized protein LOC115975455 isoform X1 [Quercus lobata]XP_030952095.1 uncharacterized protein LOC115975455 isoform X1 [Quercus lobata]XP_030952096.1 uncharacterized protein LOC115975455 isoform X1 [Quercus lobata]
MERFWDMDGLECLGDTLLILLRCRGLHILLKFLCLGRQSRIYQLAWALRMMTLSVCIYELLVTTLLANIERWSRTMMLLRLNGKVCASMLGLLSGLL